MRPAGARPACACLRWGAAFPNGYFHARLRRELPSRYSTENREEPEERLPQTAPARKLFHPKTVL